MSDAQRMRPVGRNSPMTANGRLPLLHRNCPATPGTGRADRKLVGGRHTGQAGLTYQAQRGGCYDAAARSHAMNAVEIEQAISPSWHASPSTQPSSHSPSWPPSATRTRRSSACAPATTASEVPGGVLPPENLRQAHEHNDEVLEHIYIGRRFKNDTERLEKLFAFYTSMTAAVVKAPARPSSKNTSARNRA